MSLLFLLMNLHLFFISNEKPDPCHAILPIVSLFDPMIAHCVSAFAQLRAESRHSAELVSQLIRGEYVRILREEGPWVWVRTEHGYEGFTRMEQLSIHEGDLPDFLFLHRLKKTRFQGKNPNQQYLELEGTLSMITKPEYDGIDLTAYTDLSSPPPFSASLLSQQAMDLLTVPYVWGGKTAFGLDCSGLIQFLFQKQGYSFPRDAWQQAETGLVIPVNETRLQFEEGDLLFFQHPGKRIHHVAISLGGSRYIHASEWVRVNSLNEQDPDFLKERRDTFINAKRIQPETLVPLLDSFRKL
jgi:hypothetical protein